MSDEFHAELVLTNAVRRLRIEAVGKGTLTASFDYPFPQAPAGAPKFQRAMFVVVNHETYLGADGYFCEGALHQQLLLGSAFISLDPDEYDQARAFVAAALEHFTAEETT